MKEFGKEFNFIINNGHQLVGDAELFFPDEPVQFLPEGTDMFDILVQCGIFKSKGDARKNWKRTGKEIPEGWTDLEKIGKLNYRITILNPIK